VLPPFPLDALLVVLLVLVLLELALLPE